MDTPSALEQRYAPTAPAPSLERIEPAIAMFALGIITLGIYPLVKFWGASTQYQRLLPGRASNFGTLMGAYIAATFFAAVLSGAFIGLLIFPVAYVLGWLALAESMRLRDEVRQRYGLTAPIHEASSHKGLWIAGQLLSWIVIGIVPLIVQGWWFFADHTALAANLEAQRRSALP